MTLMAHDAQSVFAAPLATVRMPVALVDLANEFQRRRFGDGDAEGNVALLVPAKPTAAVDTAIEMALRSVVDALPPTMRATTSQTCLPSIDVIDISMIPICQVISQRCETQ
jgi:hypothetical protein